MFVPIRRIVSAYGELAKNKRRPSGETMESRSRWRSKKQAERAGGNRINLAIMTVVKLNNEDFHSHSFHCATHYILIDQFLNWKYVSWNS